MPTLPSIERFEVGRSSVITTVFNDSNRIELDKALRHLLSTSRKYGVNRIIGLDIEKHYQDTTLPVTEYVSTLMLCSGDFCLVLQLCRMTSLEFRLVSKFLQLHDLTFVGVGIKHCLEALEASYGIKCRDAMDLRDMAVIVDQSENYRTYKLADLAGIVNSYFDDNKDFVFRMCNGQNDLSFWDDGTLSRDQIEAATWRAYLCFNIGNVFNRRIVRQ